MNENGPSVREEGVIAKKGLREESFIVVCNLRRKKSRNKKNTLKVN